MCECDRCEQLLQPFLDRQLDEWERAEAEEHLARCSYCRRRYVFEEKLRMYVRQSVSDEPMPAALKARLVSLRIEL
jgi:anti-sigma factor (TIGR02949 family)